MVERRAGVIQIVIHVPHSRTGRVDHRIVMAVAHPVLIARVISARIEWIIVAIMVIEVVEIIEVVKASEAAEEREPEAAEEREPEAAEEREPEAAESQAAEEREPESQAA